MYLSHIDLLSTCAYFGKLLISFKIISVREIIFKLPSLLLPLLLVIDKKTVVAIIF